jgi:ABC-type multidrug transport system ATPase subunit
VILFDEPMVGLDPKAIKELKETIIELKNNGVTILISTHMLDMVKELWDVMFIMNKGKIVGSYTKNDVNDQDIDDIFFELTGGEA